METENEIVEIKPVTFITTLPDIQIGEEAGTGRSNWQHVSSQGRLCRKLEWRWSGRFGSSNIRPDRLRQWQKPG
jgi:hypothetical protein